MEENKQIIMVGIIILFIVIFGTYVYIYNPFYKQILCLYEIGEDNRDCTIPEEFIQKAISECEEKGYSLEKIFWEFNSDLVQINCKVKENFSEVWRIEK